MPAFVDGAAIWLVAGLLLAALEMVAPGVFLLWLGLAAILTGAATAVFTPGIVLQLGLFVALTAALVALVATRLRSPGADTVNAPDAGLVGQQCRALDLAHGQGRVALGDGTWSARVADGTTPTPGQTLRVVGLEGTTLLVASL